MDDMKADLKEIKNILLDLVKQGAVHNEILGEHEKRSTNLESRIIPIEADLSFRHRLWTVTISLLSVAGVIASVVKTVIHYL